MKNHEEPAFPAQELNSSVAQTSLYWGLTKREYFAAAALQGLLAMGPHGCGADGIAHDALLFADALIKALNGETE